MRISSTSILVAGVSLAIHAADASPIGIGHSFVASGNQNGPMGIYRIGHAGANTAHIPPIPRADGVDLHRLAADRKLGAPCHGMKNTAMGLSNSLRKAIGLPLIEDAEIRIIKVESFTKFDRPRPVLSDELQLHAAPSVPEPSAHHEEDSFLKRVHAALNELSEGESMAVAFVLGSGLAVIIRMVWVFCVIFLRGLTGGDEEDVEYALVIEDANEAAEELPPRYDSGGVPAVVYSEEKTSTPSGA